MGSANGSDDSPGLEGSRRSAVSEGVSTGRGSRSGVFSKGATFRKELSHVRTTVTPAVRMGNFGARDVGARY